MTSNQGQKAQSRCRVVSSIKVFSASRQLTGLYAAQRSQEELNALPHKKGSAAGFCEPSNLVRTTERAGAIHSAGFEDDSTCDHCEGILLNNKAYRVRTQDHEIILLDMIVCYACHLEAKNLGLKTYELQAADGESELTSENNQLLALALAWPV